MLSIFLQDPAGRIESDVAGALEWVLSLAPSALALVLTIVVAVGLRHWLDRSAADPKSHEMRNNLILLGVTALGLVLVVLALPLSSDTRGQILSFLGIVLSAGIALSSTTFLGNMLAGLMLRAVRNFRLGDFIQVQEHFGRVTERGLFHTEIQTEERSLTTLPNLFLVTHPVTTVRTSGAIVHASVSLGYDVPRGRIEELLLEAAERAELEDAFVLVQELGDYSVTYRIGGLLTEVKSLISARSRLRAQMLDALHGGGVEIVSPVFQNQRKLEPDRVFIPRPAPRAASAPKPEAATSPEEIAFDKADEAEAAAEIQARLNSVKEELRAAEENLKGASDEEKPGIERAVQRLEARRDRLAARLEATKPEAG
jgi:small-conductance mechanosensitive channel